jgi:hypothetical protein
MELKDFLPLFGIAVGWLLAEGSAFGKRAIERKRTIGKSLSVLYFLFMEMVQLKMAQEGFKNLGNDVKEWERLRQRSFEKYTSQDAAFVERLNTAVDSLGEYYPIEAYKLREILTKYQFVKSKKLDVVTTNPSLYITTLSTYELGYMAHQYQLELIIRFLAFRQSKLLWARIRYKFWRMRSRVPKGDMIFLQQVTRTKKKAAVSAAAAEQDAPTSKGPTSGS